MTATVTGPTTVLSATTRSAAAPLVLGGLLMAVGGQLHPRESRATVRETLAASVASPVWNLSHLLVLAGLLVAVAGFVIARRTGAFGPAVQSWLAVAIGSWALASVEMVPHLLASQEQHALHHGEATPMLDTHLLLNVVAAPLLGLSAAALAVAVARAARTVPAWILAALAVVGGVAYAAAGPLIVIIADPKLSPLFAGQGLVAVWLIGTGIRLAARRRSRSAVA